MVSNELGGTDREQRTGRSVTGFMFSVFFLSGTCGLMYEVVWTRMLVLVVGGSTYATSIVLATFMAGMAVGSFVFGRLADRSKSPLSLYGVIQICIGIYGVLLPFIMKGLQTSYVALSGSVSSTAGLNLVRFVMAFAVLIVPSVLMGATFPVVSRYLTRSLSGLGSLLGTLYSVNTWGGVVGAFFAGMYLLASIGMRSTLFLAACINVVIGIAALAVNMKPAFRSYSGLAAEAGSVRPESGTATSATAFRTIAVFILAVSGFTSLAYEVFWTRMLIFVIGNSTWSFTVVLTTFLAGMALGSLIVSGFIDGMKRPVAFLAFIELAVALVAVLFIPFLGRLGSLYSVLPGLAARHLLAFQFIVCSLTILVPSILMGMVFPLALRLCVREAGKVGTDAGRGYSINTLASIAGALTSGFLLIPLLGLRNGIVATAFVNVLAAASLLLAERAIAFRPRLAMAASSIILFGLLSLVLPRAIYMGGPLAGSMKRIYYDDGIGGTVEVYQTKEKKINNLTINGVPEVPTDRLSMQTFMMLAHLPLLLEENPRNVLVVTFGAGIVAGAIGEHDLERIDCVEICPGVIRAARLFSEQNNNVLENPKVRINMDDGRNFLLTTRRTYDVITADATHPTGADSWVLYTEENYRLCYDKLSEHGIFAQWLPLHGLNNDEFRAILKTFSSVFPNTSVWFVGANPKLGHAIVLGVKGGATVPLDLLSRRLNVEPVKKEMEEFGLGNAYTVLSKFLLDSAAVREYTLSSKVNTDDLSRSAFTPYDLFGRDLNMVNLTSMLPLSSAFNLVKMSAQEKDTLERCAEARKHTVAGILAICNKQPDIAFEELRSALSINPDEQDAAYLLKSYGLEDGSVAYEVVVAEGRAFAQRGMYEKAIESFRRAAVVKETAGVYNDIAVSCMRLGKYDEARAALKKALGIDPDLATARENMKALETLTGKGRAR
jgi:spermidine synthase